MICADCHRELLQTDYHGINVDECPNCLGRWFDRDELRRAKDRTDQYLRWLDFDLFARDPGSPPANARAHLCPRCSVRMGQIAYESSGVIVDKCSSCHGVWLNHGEFEKIVKHLHEETCTETAAQYCTDVGCQFEQIFTGPEGPISEFRDFLAVLNLLEMRLAVERPALAQEPRTSTWPGPSSSRERVEGDLRPSRFLTAYDSHRRSGSVATGGGHVQGLRTAPALAWGFHKHDLCSERRQARTNHLRRPRRRRDDRRPVALLLACGTANSR
jgi:Zn-finger nucleic acid-binding protein